MREKSLGRGLDDIADIFLSDRKDKELRNGFSSKKLRDATCESCTNIVNDCNEASKCKIFTLQNKSYGVRFLDTVSLTSGSYCKYFKQKNSDKGILVKETSSGNTKINCDIRESVTVRRSIEYPNTPEAQQEILKSLSKHLEDNYSVKRIELRKTDRISEPNMKKCMEECVIMSINEGADHGNHN